MHIQRLKSLLSCIIILKEELAYLVIALSLVTQHSPSLEGSIGPHRKTSLWLAVTRDGRRLTTPTFLQLTFFHCGFSWAEKSICIISRISYSEYNFFASRWELDSGTRTGYIFQIVRQYCNGLYHHGMWAMLYFLPFQGWDVFAALSSSLTIYRRIGRPF